MKSYTRMSTKNLQVYAFWSGFASTMISLVHVIIIAVKGGG